LSAHPRLIVVADSRSGLRRFPPVIFKMNLMELNSFGAVDTNLDSIKSAAGALAAKNQRMVFVTLAERGILGATREGHVEHICALPLRGPIDIVGAGDAVTASLTTGLVAGATLREALEMANAAASVVIHKLGTTGTASLGETAPLLK